MTDDLTTRVSDSLAETAGKNFIDKAQTDALVDVIVNRLRSGLHDDTIAWLLLEHSDG